MNEPVNKVPVKKGEQTAERMPLVQAWHPFENLHREIDRIFADFGRGFGSRRSLFDIEPFRGREATWVSAPAVDITETDKAYVISAELPGLDEKEIEVKLVDGNLSIKGEKRAEKEEREKDYYLHERQYGAFERVFRVPEGVDAEKIEATFKNGVLALTLPKTAEAQKPEKKIDVKAS